MPTNPGLLRSWVLVVLVTVVATAALAAASLPSPVLFGSLIGGVVCALTLGGDLHIPRLGFNVGQALIGATIGALVNLRTLERLLVDWPSILGVTLGTLLISLLAGRLLALHRDASPTTGTFALVAGGASGVVAMAHELGADDRVVTVVQYLRVLLVLVAMPLVTTVVFHPTSTGGSGPAGPAVRWPADLAFTVVTVAAGLLVARVTRAPASSLLGPLLIAVALSASGVLGPVTVPVPLQNLGYALIGVQVGLRFTRESLRSIASLLPAAVGLIVAVIVACAGMGVLLSAVTGVDRLTAYLATTPGGLYAVLATAADSGCDVTYVLAVQVIRVFVMLLAIPLLARLLARRTA